MTLRSTLAALAGLGLFAASHAQIASFSINPTAAQQNNAAGNINNVTTSYDAGTKSLSYSATMSKNGTTLADSFWLVLSNGPDPKGVSGQYAIFYFDGTNKNAPKLTAYGYNGVNGGNSYLDGSQATGTQAPDTILSSLTSNFAKSLKVTDLANGARTLSFTADVTAINNRTPKYPTAGTAWEGAQFGSKIGLWFHPLAGGTTDYNANGFLKSLGDCKEGWLDLSNQHTNVVPEPASLAALGLGAVGLLRRRKRAAK